MADENPVRFPPETPVRQINRPRRPADQDLSPTEGVRNRPLKSSVNSPDTPFSPNEGESFSFSPSVGSASSPSTPVSEYVDRNKKAQSHISPLAARTVRRSERIAGKPPGYGDPPETNIATQKNPNSESNVSQQNEPSIVADSVQTPSTPSPREELSSKNQNHTSDLFSDAESISSTAIPASTTEQAIDTLGTGGSHNDSGKSKSALNDQEEDRKNFAERDLTKREREDSTVPSLAPKARLEDPQPPSDEGLTAEQIVSPSLGNRAISDLSQTSSVQKPEFDHFYSPPVTNFGSNALLLEALKYKTPKETRRSRNLAQNNMRATSARQTTVTPKLAAFGYIYIYKFDEVPGYVKIGYTEKTPQEREKEWTTKCVFRAVNVQDPHERPVRHFKLVEKLIHHQLAEYQRTFQCWRCKSNSKTSKAASRSGTAEVVYTRHQEWFQISDEVALAVARKWRDWMADCKPYDSNGRLTRYWVEKYNLVIDGSRTVDWDEWRKPPPATEELSNPPDHTTAGTSEFASEVDDISQRLLDIVDQVVALCLATAKVEVVMAVVLFIASQVSFGAGAILFLRVMKGRKKASPGDDDA